MKSKERRHGENRGNVIFNEQGGDVQTLIIPANTLNDQNGKIRLEGKSS